VVIGCGVGDAVFSLCFGEGFGAEIADGFEMDIARLGEVWEVLGFADSAGSDEAEDDLVSCRHARTFLAF
jgi:hypothetical protein